MVWIFLLYRLNIWILLRINHHCVLVRTIMKRHYNRSCMYARFFIKSGRRVHFGQRHEIIHCTDLGSAFASSELLDRLYRLLYVVYIHTILNTYKISDKHIFSYISTVQVQVYREHTYEWKREETCWKQKWESNSDRCWYKVRPVFEKIVMNYYHILFLSTMYFAIMKKFNFRHYIW